MYEKCIKRLLDFILSLLAIIMLSPLMIILSLVGFIKMKGNPFFFQDRIGKGEKVFRLVKFRSMSEAKDKDGNYLPDEKRLTKYGRILRGTSLDEIPELFNILKGDMSIVGPRPLLTSYLPYYTDKERLRHSVRPGLTGLAQVNGRSFITWEKIFNYDLEYINNLSFSFDLHIILQTVKKVLHRDDIEDATTTEKGEDGYLYAVVDGKRMKVHQRLDVERAQNRLQP